MICVDWNGLTDNEEINFESHIIFEIDKSHNFYLIRKDRTMLSKGEHQTVPLSVLLKRELAHEKIERPEISHGQANQSKKGEDFTFLKTEYQRLLGDEVTTFSVFGVCFDVSMISKKFIYIQWRSGVYHIEL